MRKTPRKCSPMTMMTTPPTTERTSMWLRTSWPMAEAAAPSAMKTVEKPSTKLSEAASTVRLATCVSPMPVSWSRLTPAM